MQQPHVTHSDHTLRSGLWSVLLTPNHRQLAIQYLFFSTGLFLFGLIVLAAKSWMTVFHPELIKVVAFPVWFANANIIALSLSFGLFGFVFGALGNLITPLQLGAGEEFHIKVARGAWWFYILGLVALIATIGPDGVEQTGRSSLLLTISGVALALSMMITGFHIIMIARLGQCSGMTVGRVPMSARVFIQLSALLILAGVLGGFVIFLLLPHTDNSITTNWTHWFTYEGSQSFWIFTAYNLLGLSFFTLLALAIDAATSWGRNPLRSRIVATLSNSLGALSFLCWNILAQFDSPICETTATVLFFIAGIAGAVSCFMLFSSAIPKEFRPHPGLYFVWAIPVFYFLSFMDRSPLNRTIAILLPGICAAIYYWYPRLRRRNLNQTVGRLHFYMSAIALAAMLLLPVIISDDQRLLALSAVAFMMLVAAQFSFIINLVASSFKYGNRIFMYAAILFIIEIIANLIPNIDHGFLGWVWHLGDTHWLLKTGMTMAAIAVMAFIDQRLLKAFPSKRKHPRPNRWVAIFTMGSSVPIFLAPLLLSGAVIHWSSVWVWTILLASSLVGFAYSFKRGNRITFGDETVDNPWRANSLEWYQRSPDEIERNISAYEPAVIVVYRDAYHYGKMENGEDFLPQWVEGTGSEESTG